MPPPDAAPSAEPVVTGTVPLYKNAQLIRADRHADRAVITGGDLFGFAAQAPLIPITVDEAERAALDCPLILVGADRAMFAVTGLAADRNLFVGEGGRYRAGAYIPAYLRRYPFVFARTDDGAHRLLCLDEASDRIVDKGTDNAEPLFVDGEATALTRQAVAFCEAFDAAEGRTKGFTDLLDDLDLLEPREARMARDGQAPELLVAYATVSRERLDALDAERLMRLREAGFLGAAYAMALSAQNWDVLNVIAQG